MVQGRGRWLFIPDLAGSTIDQIANRFYKVFDWYNKVEDRNVRIIGSHYIGERRKCFYANKYKLFENSADFLHATRNWDSLNSEAKNVLVVDIEKAYNLKKVELAEMKKADQTSPDSGVNS